jgi:hypothetical protein
MIKIFCLALFWALQFLGAYLSWGLSGLCIFQLGLLSGLFAPFAFRVLFKIFEAKNV